MSIGIIIGTVSLDEKQGTKSDNAILCNNGRVHLVKAIAPKASNGGTLNFLQRVCMYTINFIKARLSVVVQTFNASVFQIHNHGV